MARKRKKARRNPRRSYKRRAVARVRNTFSGLNFKQALKDQVPIQLGMFGTKFFAKLFGPSALEGDPSTWNWSSYAKGAAGTVATAFILQNIRAGWGQKALQGGFSLLFYKMVQNQLVQGNPWAVKHFGIDQEEMDVYVPDEYAQIDGYEPGDIEDDEQGNSYLLGQDGQWHALPEAAAPMMGDVLRPVDQLGAYERISPPGRLGQDPVAKALLDA